MTVPILLYHSVRRSPSRWIAPFTVTPATFARHLALIAEAGLQATTVTNLRQVSLPTRPVVVTFDDGFADTLGTAASMLSAYGMPATVYVTTGFVDGRSPGGDAMLSWSGVAELAAAGHEIGAHSVTHPQLDTLDRESARDEVSRSRLELEQRLGRPVHSFAYPHGYSSPLVRRLVAQAGYRTACSVKNALSPYDDPPHTLARLTVTSATTDETIRDWLAGRTRIARPYDLPATRLWRLYRRARRRLP